MVRNDRLSGRYRQIYDRYDQPTSILATVHHTDVMPRNVLAL
jgi:hypothetical protein